MKFILIIFFFIFTYSIDFNDAIDKLRVLEKYILKYKIRYSNYTFTHLISCYLRRKIYNRYLYVFWDTIGGRIPDSLDWYIKAEIGYEGKYFTDVDLPNNETIYLFHIFEIINAIEYGNFSYTSSYTRAAGWGGSVVDFLYYTLSNYRHVVNYEDLSFYANYYFNNYKSFFLADIDAPIILSKKKDNNYFSDIIYNYYINKEYLKRGENFIKLFFPNIINNITRENIREEMYKIYTNDRFLDLLERREALAYSSYNLYNNNRKAIINIFSDFLFNYIGVDINNCSKYNIEGECDFCINGYFLLNGSCVKEIKNCIEYNSKGNCKKYSQQNRLLDIKNNDNNYTLKKNFCEASYNLSSDKIIDANRKLSNKSIKKISNKIWKEIIIVFIIALFFIITIEFLYNKNKNKKVINSKNIKIVNIL